MLASILVVATSAILSACGMTLGNTTPARNKHYYCSTSIVLVVQKDIPADVVSVMPNAVDGVKTQINCDYIWYEGVCLW